MAYRALQILDEDIAVCPYPLAEILGLEQRLRGARDSAFIDGIEIDFCRGFELGRKLVLECGCAILCLGFERLLCDRFGLRGDAGKIALRRILRIDAACRVVDVIPQPCHVRLARVRVERDLFDLDVAALADKRHAQRVQIVDKLRRSALVGFLGGIARNHERP